jgi:hypothetical protein
VEASLLLFDEAVGKTGPHTGALIGRGTTALDAALVACSGGTSLSMDASYRGSFPPLRAQPILTDLPDSLASKEQ